MWKDLSFVRLVCSFPRCGHVYAACLLHVTNIILSQMEYILLPCSEHRYDKRATCYELGTTRTQSVVVHPTYDRSTQLQKRVTSGRFHSVSRGYGCVAGAQRRKRSRQPGRLCGLRTEGVQKIPKFNLE